MKALRETAGGGHLTAFGKLALFRRKVESKVTVHVQSLEAHGRLPEPLDLDLANETHVSQVEQLLAFSREISSKKHWALFADALHGRIQAVDDMAMGKVRESVRRALNAIFHSAMSRAAVGGVAAVESKALLIVIHCFV